MSIDNIRKEELITVDCLRDLTAAIRSGSSYDKVASKFSEILAIGGYMYGAARQIYGALNDGKYHMLTSADTDKIKIENENERIRIELPVQPDIEEFIGETRPRKVLGEPYLETANGRFVSGYLSTFKTPMIVKPLEFLEVYPYDFVKEMKESRHLSIFKKEDLCWFYGCYQLIGELEEKIPGASIAVCSKVSWDEAPHKPVIDLMKLHGSPVKRNQPRELLVMPEELYLDFGKIDHAVVNNVASDFLKSGFSPNDSPLYQMRKLMLRDSRGLTCDLETPARSLFQPNTKVANTPMKAAAMLLTTFGYNVEWNGKTGADSIGYDAKEEDVTYASEEERAAAIYSALTKRYSPIIFNANLTDAEKVEFLAKSSFQRILVYSPINYLGRVYLWNRDIRNHIKVENDVVSTYSDEKITYMFHNIYAVTALDVWDCYIEPATI